MDPSTLAITNKSTGQIPFLDGLQALLSGLGQGGGGPQMGDGRMPWQATPMLDTMAPSMGGGGDMAAIQQALRMLAQLMAQQQAGAAPSDPMASMMGGTGAGY